MDERKEDNGLVEIDLKFCKGCGICAEVCPQSARDTAWMQLYAEAVLISPGSMSGSVKHIVDQYRAKGLKVGNLRIVSFRPFPRDELDLP